MILLESCVHESLPCSESSLGNFFLLCIYSLILGYGSKNISDGSELLIEITPPGIIGGIILPLLGTLPDSCIIIASCLFGTKEEIQHKLSVAVGTLAGSDVLLLTIPLAAGIYLGRCDIENGKAVEQKYTKFSWKNTGVTVFPQIKVIAAIVIVSLFSFLLVQFGYNSCPGCEGEKLEKHEEFFNFAGMVLSGLFFVGYTIYQFVETTLQSKRNKLAKEKLLKQKLMNKFVNKVQNEIKFSIITPSNENSLQFQGLNSNKNLDDDQNLKEKELEDIELNQMASGEEETGEEFKGEKNIKNKNKDKDKDVRKISGTFDNKKIQIQLKNEKMQKITKNSHKKHGESLLVEMMFNKDGKKKSKSHSKDKKSIFVGIESSNESEVGLLSKKNENQKLNSSVDEDDVELNEISEIEMVDDEQMKKTKKDQNGLVSDGSDLSDESESSDIKMTVNKRKMALKAAYHLMIGTLSIVLFCDALVVTITKFSSHIGLSPFYIAFVVAPTASNSAELFTSVIFAKKKKMKTNSLVFASLYGAVVMNNTFSLAVLCGLIYYKKLIWDFTAEVISMSVVNLSLSVLAIYSNTVKLYHILWIIPLYPLSILIVWILNTTLGWD
ncbi:sodium/calcium exchanger ncl [Anaeramoeba flamelloides]|uniref:Sodium/calcium exchanger ncl n=1 Tax=Anaeramoeba flamelloides TaxID=1746091 RepID=A0AAV8A7H0_9EUKA|nr:sodium/calcium exchanger ncl [Anaeramoeba flamelloides]